MGDAIVAVPCPRQSPSHGSNGVGITPVTDSRFYRGVEAPGPCQAGKRSSHRLHNVQMPHRSKKVFQLLGLYERGEGLQGLTHGPHRKHLSDGTRELGRREGPGSQTSNPQSHRHGAILCLRALVGEPGIKAGHEHHLAQVMPVGHPDGGNPHGGTGTLGPGYRVTQGVLCPHVGQHRLSDGAPHSPSLARLKPFQVGIHGPVVVVSVGEEGFPKGHCHLGVVRVLPRFCHMVRWTGQVGPTIPGDEPGVQAGHGLKVDSKSIPHGATRDRGR